MLFGVKPAESPELPMPFVPAASQGVWLTSSPPLLTPGFIIQAVQAEFPGHNRSFSFRFHFLKLDASGFQQNCCVLVLVPGSPGCALAFP